MKSLERNMIICSILANFGNNAKHTRPIASLTINQYDQQKNQHLKLALWNATVGNWTTTFDYLR